MVTTQKLLIPKTIKKRQSIAGSLIAGFLFNTSWCLAAQVNHDELYSEPIYRLIVITLMTLGLIALLVIGLAFLHRSRQKTILQSLLNKEKELRKYHEEFRTILYSIGDGVITTDVQGRIRQMNHAAAELTGWNETDAVGRRFDEVFRIINERTRNIVENPIVKVLRDGTIVGLANHTLLLAKDGREIPIADSGAPIRNNHGAIEGTVLVFRDKTEEHISEKLISESKARLDRGETVSKSGNWEFDLDKGMIVASDGAKHIFEIEGDRWPIAEIRKMAVPPDRQRLEQAMRGLIEHGEPYDVTYQIRRRKSGIVLDIHSRAEYDRDKRIIFGVIQDITERKRIERQLRYLSRSVEQSPSSMIITDLEGNIEYANPKCTQVTGYSFNELLGQNPRVLKSGKTPPDEYQRLWEAITAGGEWRGEFQNRKKNGNLYWESALISPIFDDNGAITHFLALKEDITEQKRLEQQLLQSQKLEGLGTLAGGIAHDFNNLLAMILGSAELLQSHLAAQPEVKKFVDRIIDASLRGTSISRQLLTFSRPNETELKPIVLAETIAEAQDMFAHFLPKTITIRASIEADHGIIMGDVGQLHQALLNLAINAGDAMMNNGTLTIREYRVDAAAIRRKFGCGNTGPYVAVSLSDTGIGMDAGTLEKIFDPFFSTKEKGKGTGLGLSNVHGIVKNHNGFIDVDSTPGEGTTFTMYFPTVPAPIEKEHVPLQASAAQPTETILLADDETSIRDMLSEYLGSVGYHVLTASDGHQALKIFVENRGIIKAVITDLGMPQMGGEELFRRLQEIDPAVKVIASSGYLDGTTKNELLSIGFIEILTKPYKLQEIKSVVHSVLNTTEKK